MQASWSCPISKRSSRFLQNFQSRHSEIADLKQAHLCAGRDSVSFSKSMRIPRNDSRDAGPSSLCGAIGKPRLSHSRRLAWLHSEVFEGPSIRIVQIVHDILPPNHPQQGIGHGHEELRRRPVTERKGSVDKHVTT